MRIPPRMETGLGSGTGVRGWRHIGLGSEALPRSHHQAHTTVPFTATLPPGPGSGLGVQSSLAGAGGVGSPSPEGRLRGCSSRVVLRGPGGLPRPAEVPPFLILQEARPLGILGDRLGLLRSVRLRALSSGPGNRRCVPWTQRAAPGNLGGGTEARGEAGDRRRPRAAYLGLFNTKL